MLKLKDLCLVESRDALSRIPAGKVLINTINAHSFNVAQEDDEFADALRTDGRSCAGGDDGCVKYLIPDGASIVKACRWLGGRSVPKERIAGWDLFSLEMRRLEKRSRELVAESDGSACRPLRVMFLGSSEKVLGLIRERAGKDWPHLDVVTYSPPYKAEFSDGESAAMVRAVNDVRPDLLWVGMTAPKQEKWVYRHWSELDIRCHVGTVGAVFDFYAGTAVRAPRWWQEHGLEWLYRLCIEPRRMWRRYVVGNPLFVWNVGKEKRKC